MSDTVIRVENVSKLYRLGEVGTGSLAHDVNRWWHKVRGLEDPYAKVGQTNDRTQAAGDADYAWALQGVSFEVRKGEVLGIIGRNGAGKSTLLKILSRVTQQTEGRIKVRGRIASLLEVGTGFHPQLTGRENIFLNGAILGMRKAEIARKFDEIVEFSGCARYIDTPVKRYSSGMYVRLAFAVAAHLEPEILIVDEVLAVGDAEFQKKCLGKMKDVAGHGRTILFVSHNMTAVQSLCSRCLVMQNGLVEFAGNTVEAIQKYYTKSGLSSHERVWESWDEAPGSEVLKVKSVKAVSLRTDREDASLFDMKTPIDIQIAYRVFKKAQVHITLHFVGEQDEVIFTSGSKRAEGWEDFPEPGDYRLVCHIPANLLNERDYFVKLLVVENGNKVVCQESDVIGLDIKDLTPRPLGSYHGKEPGPLKPILNWSLNKIANA